MAVPALLFEELERLIQMNHVRVRRRNIRDITNPFELPNNEFRKQFRLNKFTVRQLIEDISPYMEEGTYVTYIPAHLQIFAALTFFGKGSYQLEVGQSFHLGMSQSSVSRAVTHVTDAIRHIANQKIVFPTTAEEKNRVKRSFQETFNFSNVIGAIDCTHVAIIAPPAEDPNYPARIYYNRKGYTSINTQLV